MTEGGITFTRLTYIVPVISNNGNITVIASPTTPETPACAKLPSPHFGKRGTITHVVSIQNIINNPNTVMSDVVVKGTVTDFLTGNSIPRGALVDVAEKCGMAKTTRTVLEITSSTCLPGHLILSLPAPGYYPEQTFTLSIPPGGFHSTLPFALTAIGTGTDPGDSVWTNKHLVISQVVASTGS